MPCPRRAGDAGVARKAISLSAGLSAKIQNGDVVDRLKVIIINLAPILPI